MFAYAFYQLGAFLAKRMSLPAARRASAVVGRLACIFQRRNRRNVYENLAIAFGDRFSPRELKRLRMKIYQNFSIFVADFLKLPEIEQENLSDWLTEESIEKLRSIGELARRGESVVLFTAHLGHWELGAASLALLGFPLWVPVGPHPSRLVTRFFNSRRRGRGLSVVSLDGVHQLFRGLARDRLAAIVGDRDLTGQGIPVRFLGRTVSAPAGYAFLARKLGAKIIPGFLLLGEDGRYDLHLADPVIPGTSDDEEADVRHCVERCLAIVEEYVRRFPEQWYVFRPVWRTENQRTQTDEDACRDSLEEPRDDDRPSD